MIEKRAFAATIVPRDLRLRSFKSGSQLAFCECGWREVYTGRPINLTLDHNLYLARHSAAEHLKHGHGAQYLDHRVGGGTETLHGIDQRELSRTENKRVQEIFWAAVNFKKDISFISRKVALPLSDHGGYQSWCARTGNGRRGFWRSLDEYLKSIHFYERPARAWSQASDESDDSSERQRQHQWYGTHSELNWTHRVQGESMGIDNAHTYVNNWQESE